MAQQLINIGTTVNDGTGDTLRSGAQKINANFAELYLTTLPTQTGQSGKFLTTDGTGTKWEVISDTIVAAANQLTGTTLAPTVTSAPGLTTIGTLIDLAVTNPILGNITGNAATVTDGVYTTGTYNDPTWITALAGSKITGDIAGGATFIKGDLFDPGLGQLVADQDIGIYKTEVYANPQWISSLSAAKVLPSPIGQAGKFLTTNGSVDDSGYTWGTFNSIPGGAANKILYQTGVGNTGFLPAPVSNGTYLKFNGTGFEWTATGTGQGTVTQVTGTGSVSGLTLSGDVTSSGALTLSGTLVLTSGNVTSGLGYTPSKLNDFDVVVNSPSGAGNLAYNDVTGVFTFTPPAPPVGTVNNFLFTDGNGFDGTVTLATSTPTLSLAMTVTGLLKGNGTGFTTATPGTDYLTPFTSTTANLVFASPNATSGVPTFRQLVSTDIPILNQNTTGSAARLTVARNINGQAFDGTADITITVPVSNGVTGMANGVVNFLTTPTSSTLATIITDETGSGSLVFGTSPTISAAVLANPTVTTSISTSSTSFDLLASTVTTINFGGETTTMNIGSTTTTASTTNLAVGVTATGTTKTLNIGTGGASGSTTNVTVGSTAGGSIALNSDTSVTGNLSLVGQGKIFTADFSNATIANRTYFKSSVANGQTSLVAVPNGSSTDAKIGVVNNSTPTNASRIYMGTNGTTEVQIVADAFGSGTYLPMAFYTNSTKQVTISTGGDLTVVGSGNLSVSGAGNITASGGGNIAITSTGKLGYDTGSGGTVTQGTNRTTGVTINKTNGAITLFSDVTVAATFTSFTVTNSAIAATDTVILNMKSGSADSYIFSVSAVSAGSFRVQIYNVAAVAVAEAPVLNFSVIKAVTA